VCHKAFKKAFPIRVLDMLRPFHGVDQTLEFLHSQGVAIAVVSCLNMNAIEMCLTRLRFKDFRYKVHYERTKEECAEPINDLVKNCGVSKKRTVYVGDTLADIRMAKKAGVISVAVKSGALGQHDPQKLREENPDYLLEDFRGLPGVVLRREMSENARTSEADAD